eukprot:Skav221122  [mRNA]  locus=scaffold233:378774:379758:- [translate_table: standard]
MLLRFRKAEAGGSCENAFAPLAQGTEEVRQRLRHMVLRPQITALHQGNRGTSGEMELPSLCLGMNSLAALSVVIL